MTGLRARATRVLLFLCGSSFFTSTALATDFHVGPGQTLREVEDVPWESLNPGDNVIIHWRPEPYRSKWVIGRSGSQGRPITVRGEAGPKGESPVIEGRDARTRKTLSYWHEQRSIIKVGGANVPADTFPSHIIIEGLEVRGGRPPFTYHGAGGEGRYVEFAAGIFIEKGGDIVIRNCVLTDNANGLLVASQAKDITVERCWIYGNGLEENVYAHNVYTSAAGMTFQFNRFGPLRAGCPGNNLKDRSAGLVVRCNWIEGGNQELDLVDAEDRESLRENPRYHEALVYGNVLIEPDGDGRNNIVHFGGDSGKTQWYRRGPLRFYHNTVVTYQRANTTLFRLSTNDQLVDAQNNVFATVNGGRLSVVDSTGAVQLGANWMTQSWRKSIEGLRGKIIENGPILTGAEPGFRDVAGQDFHLNTNSPCIGAAKSLGAGVMPDPWRTEEYVPHRMSHSGGRRDDEPSILPTLGAFQIEESNRRRKQDAGN